MVFLILPTLDAKGKVYNAKWELAGKGIWIDRYRPNTFDKKHTALYHKVMFVPKPPEVFESRDVRSLVGVSERELRHWADLKIIVPAIADSQGKPGIRRKYSFKNLVEVGLLKTLLRHGFNLYEARKILEKYQYSYKKTLPGPLYLVVQEKTTWLVESPKGGRSALWAKLDKFLDPELDRDAFFVVAIHHIQERLAKHIQMLYSK
jgi:DNA-binding transcriptional MerR regulator